MVSMGTMMGSRRATRTVALICVLALAGPARWASAATVVEIAKNPAAFDQKTVTVTGTAAQVSSRTSRRGNPYTTFKLSDQGETVKVPDRSTARFVGGLTRSDKGDSVNLGLYGV